MEDKNIEIVDNTLLAQDVADKINFSMTKFFLVKPLDPVMVKKEFSKPVSNSEPKKDDNGVEAVDYDTVETEVKEVESDYRKGIVLKVPYNYTQQMADEKFPAFAINVGDVIVFENRFLKYFDLCKDTMLVAPYDVIAKEK